MINKIFMQTNTNNWIYPIANKASKIYKPPEKINLLCYTVNESSMYPFLLFLFEKNTVDNILYFPTINILDEDIQIDELIHQKILEMEKSSHLIIDYKGIVCDNDDNYFFVVELKEYNFNENIYFALSSEIINNKKFYYKNININININISENIYINIDRKIINIFTNNPIFGLLINLDTKFPYKLPDVVFKKIKKEEINYYLTFGSKKEQIFESCDEYYYFNRSIENTNIDNEYCYIKYALFCGNKIHFETDEDGLTLTNYELYELLDDDIYKTLYITYLENLSLPDMLVMNSHNFCQI